MMNADTTMTTAGGKVQLSWRELLKQAFENPGHLAEVYSVLHRFSIGNQVLAEMQAAQRGLPIGPIATYKQWQQLGRQVRKGEKAIWLWRPISVASTRTDEQTGEESTVIFTHFTMRPQWFLLSQTDGDDYSEPAPVGDWDWRRACEALGVRKTDFAITDPALGYASADKTIAVTPYNPHPLATICHELAHIVLCHTAKNSDTPQPIQEIQAESVAYLVGATVGFGGADDSRGYIQFWAQQGGVKGIEDLSEAQVRAIFSAAEKIRKAGLPQQATQTNVDRAMAA